MGLRHDSVYYFLFLLLIVILYSFCYSFDVIKPDIRCSGTIVSYKTGILNYSMLNTNDNIKTLMYTKVYVQLKDVIF